MGYITIAEYAKRAGVSKQTAYNRRKAPQYTQYFHIVNGILSVDTSIFNIQEKSKNQSNFQEKFEKVESLSETESLLFSILKKQIDQQNKQIESLYSLLAEKDKTITQLTESTNALINTVQTLQHERNLIEAGKIETEKEVPPSVNIPIVQESKAEMPKKGLFSRLWKNK